MVLRPFREENTKSFFDRTFRFVRTGLSGSGTRKKLDAFTFDFRQTEWGWFTLHAYRFDAEWSTFIVETPEVNWLKAGMDKSSVEPVDCILREIVCGASGWKCSDFQCQTPERSGSLAEVQSCPLRAVASQNIVLIGDAAHTAHFGIGSGTKLAMEDAMALSRVLNLLCK